MLPIVALDAALDTCGEKRRDFLDQLALQWPADKALLLHLSAFAAQADPLPQMAATGLLKRYLAAGASFPDPVVCRLLDLLPAVVRWEARLQLLQMLPSLAIPAERAVALQAFCSIASPPSAIVLCERGLMRVCTVWRHSTGAIVQR